jgi:hypothetical protein
MNDISSLTNALLQSLPSLSKEAACKSKAPSPKGMKKLKKAPKGKMAQAIHALAEEVEALHKEANTLSYEDIIGYIKTVGE